MILPSVDTFCGIVLVTVGGKISSTFFPRVCISSLEFESVNGSMLEILLGGTFCVRVSTVCIDDIVFGLGSGDGERIAVKGIKLTKM